MHTLVRTTARTMYLLSTKNLKLTYAQPKLHHNTILPTVYYSSNDASNTPLPLELLQRQLRVSASKPARRHSSTPPDICRHPSPVPADLLLETLHKTGDHCCCCVTRLSRCGTSDIPDALQ